LALDVQVGGMPGPPGARSRASIGKPSLTKKRPSRQGDRRNGTRHPAMTDVAASGARRCVPQPCQDRELHARSRTKREYGPQPFRARFYTRGQQCMHATPFERSSCDASDPRASDRVDTTRGAAARELAASLQNAAALMVARPRAQVADKARNGMSALRLSGCATPACEPAPNVDPDRRRLDPRSRLCGRTKSKT
jgi:hypothetical protein